ncbi:MAG: hypothetical protein CMO73_13290 [Verrucomicrobiales bacterium]|nr:hypothetical protein [Verrucomicrobiales bacterium]
MRIFQLTLALLIFSFSHPIIADVPSVDLLSADRLSQSVEGFGVLPKAKGDSLKQYLLISKERNPFAIRAKKEQIISGSDSQTEESKIRSVLEKLHVSGVAKGLNGYKVQLGGVILAEGRKMPKVIHDQTDDLIVTKITPSLVEITWAGDEEADEPRKLTIEVDLKPKIGTVLPVPSNINESSSSQLVYLNEEEPEAD